MAGEQHNLVLPFRGEQFRQVGAAAWSQGGLHTKEPTRPRSPVDTSCLLCVLQLLSEQQVSS